MDGHVRATVKGNTMSAKAVDPFLQLILERLKLKDDVQYFFRLAYIWRFPNKPLLDSRYYKIDVLRYETRGIEPPYVLDYLTHIKNDQVIPSP